MTTGQKKEERTIKDLIRELERLNRSRYVALARKDAEVRKQLEAQLEELHALEERGKAIADADVDVAFLDSLVEGPDWGC
jgi:hypothetical protein